MDDKRADRHEEFAESLAPARIEKVRRRVSDFSRELIKVFLQTGYYSEKHPMSKEVVNSLYSYFRELIAGFTEISYMLSHADETEDILVEGITAKPMRLMELLKGEMGEHFVKKFVEYFNRNRIVLFSIKSAIGPEEFERFVFLIVRWHLLEKDAHKEGAQFDTFTESLFKEGVKNVAVIHFNDLIESEYQMPWQLRIVMTRLRKDLKLLPMFSALSEKEIAFLKRQVVEEIVRPIRRMDIIMDILLHSDIIVMGIPNSENIDLESEVVNSISYPLAVGTCAKLLDAHARAKDAALQEKIKKNIKLLAYKLDEQHDYRGRELLDEIMNRKILLFDELPPKTKEMETYKAIVEDYVNNSEAHLREFEKIEDGAAFEEKLRLFGEVVPMLVKIRKYRLLSDYFSVLAPHMMQDTQPEIGKVVSNFFKNVGDAGIFDRIAENLSKEKKEVREEMFSLFYPFGTASLSSLLRVLYETDSSQVRQEICGFIAGFKEKARETLEQELAEKRHTWFMVRNLIMILHRIGNPESATIISKFVSHENPKVRIECANALHSLLGRNAEPHLLYLVNAPEEEVKRRAIILLGTLKTQEESFFNFIRGCVRLKMKGEQEYSDVLQSACLRALLEYDRGEISIATNGLEEALIEAIKGQKKSLLKKLLFFSRHQLKSDAVIELMVEVLKKHGTENSQECLAARKIDIDLSTSPD